MCQTPHCCRFLFGPQANRMLSSSLTYDSGPTVAMAASCPPAEKTGLGLIAFLTEVWVMTLLAYNQGRLWADVRKCTHCWESNRNTFSYREGGREWGRGSKRKTESTCQMAPSLGKFQALCHVFVVPLGGWNCLHLSQEIFHTQDRLWVTGWVIRLDASVWMSWSDNGAHSDLSHYVVSQTPFQSCLKCECLELGLTYWWTAIQNYYTCFSPQCPSASEEGHIESLIACIKM